MKVKCNSVLCPDNVLSIGDTNDLTAQRLLAYFLESHDSLVELVGNAKMMEEFDALLDKCRAAKIDIDLIRFLEYLPWEIVHCFLVFLQQSPHVHVTID